jgi:predicted lipoprotein with Yx(FWY)xxD motif
MGRRRIAAGALPLILILAACSSAATPAPTTPPAASQPAAASQPVASEPAASEPAASDAGASGGTAESYDLKVNAGSGSATNYLSGEDGKTLYVFAKDVANSGKSACGAGPCLDNWPPFTVSSLDEVKEDTGVSGTLAVITRDDGTKQVTYNGQPLYYFAGDSAAGDTNGKAIPSWSLAHP